MYLCKYMKNMRIHLIDDKSFVIYNILKARKNCLLFNYTTSVNSKSKYCTYLVCMCISIGNTYCTHLTQ